MVHLLSLRVRTAPSSNSAALLHLPLHPAEMRELAGDSLTLLRDAIYDPHFPALFDLRVWGSIIGMFELNNLGLFVPSPVARWRRLVEALPEAEREEVEEEVGECVCLMPRVRVCLCGIEAWIWEWAAGGLLLCGWAGEVGGGTAVAEVEQPVWTGLKG